MAKRKMPINRNWKRWSASKLGSALSCPLRCFFQSMLKIEAPSNAAAALGQGMHYMFERFYKPHKSTGRYPYQSLDKFKGAWKGFYWQAIKGKHGFSSMSSKPIEIKWRDKNHPGETFGLGNKILEVFFENNNKIRLDNTPRFVERRFSINWHEITISGIIDRIDLTKKGAIVLDYKPWNYSEYQRKSDIQMTIYQLAYEKYLQAKIGNNLPLHALQIYSYRSKEKSIENIPLRSSHDFGLLYRYLRESLEYYRSILTDNSVRKEIVPEFKFFPEEDINKGDIFPKLPRGQHCTYCSYVKECIEWESGNHENARKLFDDKNNQIKNNLEPQQKILPFEENTKNLNSDKKIKNFTEDTIVENGKKDYKKISKKKKIKEQLSFDL